MNKQIKSVSTLAEDVEYIIIQDEITKEIIAKITPQNSDVKYPYVIRTKFKKKGD